MNSADFDTQFTRLTSHFSLPADADKVQVGADWYKAVQHYHVDALEHGVTVLIKSAQDRYWPALGRLLSIVQGRISIYDREPGKCATCAGSTWIESWPMKTPDNRVYEYLQRCPDCGVPSPEVKPKPHMTMLTKDEYERFKSGNWEHPPMPKGLEAKPRPAGEQTEIRAAMERLRVKLFGKHSDVA